ncbi:acetate/propionate family kinase [Zhouia amylolytica]|uniref:acetate/propionate family kinase n=1 Tax=Zhouia amylolytica TaxID=376730 RepID=UPI0020CF65AD|nr:acetate kinase [Zhouia amylolytica]MCQ0112819.1 acetate kinase [Zhouia amylolytica]
MKNILVINSGSSSIKFQLFKMPEAKVDASGLVERIGLDDATIHYKTSKLNLQEKIAIPDHKTGLKEVAKLLMDPEDGVISDAKDIDIVGHRVVHGGASFSDTILIDNIVKKKIKDLFNLAPLHNPHNYTGIDVAENIFPNAKQVAVFDTAFHQTIPEKAYKYAIPNEFLEKNRIRLYGFHGTSHKYVYTKTVEYLAKPLPKVITVHLGNGCSITAIHEGKSVDHSLGFGPVNGLIMGTRSGDIDQSVIFYMIDKLGYTPAQVSELLHKKSGMLGLTGYSDLRNIEEEASKGNTDCLLALEMNAYRIKKYIGSYIAAMNGIDALVFTAGIGENSSTLRRMVCSELDYLGIQIDPDKNNIRSKDIRLISHENARVDVLVVPTNEELEIARQAYGLLKN